MIQDIDLLEELGNLFNKLIVSLENFYKKDEISKIAESNFTNEQKELFYTAINQINIKLFSISLILLKNSWQILDDYENPTPYLLLPSFRELIALNAKYNSILPNVSKKNFKTSSKMLQSFIIKFYLEDYKESQYLTSMDEEIKKIYIQRQQTVRMLFNQFEINIIKDKEAYKAIKNKKEIFRTKSISSQHKKLTSDMLKSNFISHNFNLYSLTSSLTHSLIEVVHGTCLKKRNNKYYCESNKSLVFSTFYFTCLTSLFVIDKFLAFCNIKDSDLFKQLAMIREKVSDLLNNLVNNSA